MSITTRLPKVMSKKQADLTTAYNRGQLEALCLPKTYKTFALFPIPIHKKVVGQVPRGYAYVAKNKMFIKHVFSTCSAESPVSISLKSFSAKINTQK